MTQKEDEIVERLLKLLSPRVKSLIITVYGDAISHRGGEAWLGSVIDLLKPFGFTERAVRTSVLRLSGDDWLVARSIGRRSYYHLTDIGQRRFTAAHERIYKTQTSAWDNYWTVVCPSMGNLKASQRESLRRDLSWMGFGQLTPGIFLHPNPDENSLKSLFSDQKTAPFIVRGQPSEWLEESNLEATTRQCWDLDRLEKDYENFLNIFRPTWNVLSERDSLSPELCFSIRTLLMHGYRKAILRDPMLPEELLPAGWPGKAARTLSRNLYRLVERKAEEHVSSIVETADGPVPEPHPSYFLRFGGLRDDET